MQYIYVTRKSSRYRWLDLIAQTNVCAMMQFYKQEYFMPRRSILSKSELEGLFSIPDSKDELIRLYTLIELDISVIKQRRGESNRLGFAIQLCYMRHPGVTIDTDKQPPFSILRIIASQLKIDPASWVDYGRRENTPRPLA